MATYYFAYGADMDTVELDLQHDRRRRPRIRFAKSTPASLPGYKLICDISSNVRRGGIFNVIPDPASEVYGILYVLHPGDTISVGTLKEGEVAKYALSLLTVKLRRGSEMVPALVLHAIADKKQLKPSSAYLNIVVQAAKNHGLPAEWLQYLKTFQPE